MIPVSRPCLGAAELAGVKDVFDTGWLGMGKVTYQFEEQVRERIGAAHLVSVNTGTSAIHLALEGFGIGPGDEVIVPSLTFAASVQAILATGAEPVFCECHPDTLLIDVDDASRRITGRTRAIMPVHYCGQAADMDALLAVATRHDLVVVEDAAHAFGSTSKGRPIGSFGHATCFSFDPIKIVTCGEGGAIAVQDAALAEKLRVMRLLGINKDTWHRYKNTRAWFYEVTDKGFRYHLPNFCAAIGVEQLRHLDDFIASRRRTCRRYDAAFSPLALVTPLNVDYGEVAPFTYIVRVGGDRRGAFMSYLRERGVDTGVHYQPNHRHPYFARFERGPLPVTEAVSEEIVTIPLWSRMADADVSAVIDAVTSFDAAERLDRSFSMPDS